MKTWACLCEFDEVRSTVVTKNALRWEAWWQFVHIDRRACPEEAMAAFVLFHFWGSMGVSEAKAESVGSILKNVGSTSNLGTHAPSETQWIPADVVKMLLFFVCRQFFDIVF